MQFQCFFRTLYEHLRPPKTNMTLENPSFEDVFPIGHVDFPASHVSFSGVVHHPDTSATVFSHGGDIMAFMVSIASRWSLDPFFQGKPRSGVPQDFEAIPCHIWKKYMWCVWKLLREINLMRFFDDVVFFWYKLLLQHICRHDKIFGFTNCTCTFDYV